MSRTKRGPASLAKRKGLLKRAKGYCRGRNTRLKIAKETVMRALRYAKRDRRVRKREMRSLWIQRISAACSPLGISYSRFISGLNGAEVKLDRKVLAHIACTDPETFQSIAEVAKENSAATNRAAA